MNTLSRTASIGAIHPQFQLIRSVITVALFSFVMLLVSACQPIQPLPTQAEEPDGAARMTPDNAPISITLPELGLEIPVTPMGWRVTEVNGQRTTEWVVPEAAAGWHRNSAAVGEPGNMIFSGHQAAGDAVFAFIAVGEASPGQEIIVTDADGEQVRYRVVQVSDPLPIDGASQQEQEQAAAYLAQDGTPRLTLITGWPAFTASHRVFVVAAPVSE